MTRSERKRLDLPPVSPPDDLDEAIQARKSAERALRLSHARRTRVDRALRVWREIRRTNHFSAAIDQIQRDAT